MSQLPPTIKCSERSKKTTDSKKESAFRQTITKNSMGENNEPERIQGTDGGGQKKIQHRRKYYNTRRSKKQLGEEFGSEELIKQKIRLQRELDLPERCDEARRIKQKFKESRKMIQGDEYDVDIDSGLANRVVEELEDIDERSASAEELEELKILVEKFIVEEKDIESPELENQDKA